jgi:formate transporter
MYLLPYALAVKSWAAPEFWAAIGREASAYSALTVASALRNIAVTTVGNLVGGSLLVGIVYWFVYLRRRL